MCAGVSTWQPVELSSPNVVITRAKSWQRIAACTFIPPIPSPNSDIDCDSRIDFRERVYPCTEANQHLARLRRISIGREPGPGRIELDRSCEFRCL